MEFDIFFFECLAQPKQWPIRESMIFLPQTHLTACRVENDRHAHLMLWQDLVFVWFEAFAGGVKPCTLLSSNPALYCPQTLHSTVLKPCTLLSSNPALYCALLSSNPGLYCPQTLHSTILKP